MNPLWLGIGLLYLAALVGIADKALPYFFGPQYPVEWVCVPPA